MKHIVSFLFVISALSATTINIPSDYTTIQAGINASVDGDTVLVAQGTYSENLILANEIVLASHAIYDDLESDWLDNDNINNTIVNGAHNGSCLVIKDGNIEPTIIGLTFQDGIGTSILETVCGTQHQKRSGGAILIYKAYPTINYNRFINNGFNTSFGVGGGGVAEGGAISHFADDDVEFDEDMMNNSSQNNHSSRDIPEEMNIQNNYFENNSSGDGENFYSHGYEGSIDVSHSVFEDIDCATNSVNDFVLKSRKNEADYVQNDISGNCIEGNSFYVSVEGSNDNQGTNASPFKTIGHALSLRMNNGIATTIHILEGVYSPSTNGEQFPIVLPDNVHLIGDNMDNSIIDAEANEFKESRVIIIEDCENVKVANLTISGGYHTTGGCIGGAGILVGSPEWISNNSNPVLENLIISENHSSKGAGIYVSWESNPEIKNCKIINNSIGLGPNGIPLQPAGAGIALFYSNGSLDNILVKDNICEHDGYGAGIAIQSSTVSINKTTITQNINARGYYGFLNNNANYANVRFINSLIHENELYDVVLDSGDDTEFFYTAYGTTYGNVQYGEGSFDITANMIVTDEDGFILPPNSVCIDAGTTDIDGDGDEEMEYINDYFGTAPDMGVFEYSPTATGLQYSIQGLSVTLTWDAITDAQYYKIERSTDSLFVTGVESSFLQINTYTDNDIEFDTEYFYRVSAYLGYWTDYSNTISVILESVNIVGDNDIPIVYKVHQNHPNPFNPVTSLRYDLPEDGLINITIYDIMGRVVKTLLNSSQTAGYKSTQWNATNNQGQPVSAGVYLYSIEAGEFRQTKKMILLK